MKKFVISFAMILLSCVFVLAGCGGNKGLKDNPPASATAFGNGGNAIVKGDYLYYVNGYVDKYTDTYTSKTQNEWGSVSFGAIYRTKLSNGQVVKDKKGFLEKTEVVVPRLVGFENGKFYIVGDQIYYSTPLMREDASGKVRNDFIQFNKVNIDGTKNSAFYVAESQIDTANWTVVNYDGKDYLLIVETAESSKVIKSVDIEKKEVKVLGENIVSWAFPSENNLEKANEKGYYYNQYVYFTRSIVEGDNISDGGNVVVKASFVTGESNAYTIKQDTTKTIVGLQNDMLYYSVEQTGKNKDLYATDITLNAFNENNMSALTNGGFASFYVVPNATLTVVAIDEDKNVFLCVNGVSNKILFSDGTDITILGVDGQNILYIDSDNNIKIKNYVTNAEATSLMTDGKTYLVNKNRITLANGKVYVFAEYESEGGSKNYYLNYINLSNIEEGTFVGLFEEGHLPKEPEKVTDEMTGEEYTPVWVK